MKLRIIISVLIFSAFQNSIAQNPKADSLRALLIKQKEDTVRVNMLNSLSLELYKSDLDSAIIIGTQALTVSKKIHWKKGEGYVRHLLGVFNYMKGNYAISLEWYTAALAIWKELKNSPDKSLSRYGKIYTAKTSLNIGNIYVDQSDYTKALDYFFTAIHMAEELGDKKTRAISLGNIGNIYRAQEQADKALEYYNKSLTTAIEMDDKLMMANQLSNMGGVYRMKKETSKAREHYKRALNIAESNGLQLVMAGCYGTIGLMDLEREQYDSALVNFRKALNVAEGLGDNRQVQFCLANIGQLYLKTKKYKESEKYLLEAMKMARQQDAKFQLQSIEHALSDLYEAKGEPAQAFGHYKEYIAIRDSIRNEENKKELFRSEVNYEYEKKKMAAAAEQEKKDALTAEEKQQQRMILYFVIGGLVIIVIFSFFLYKRFKVTQKQKALIEEQKHLVEEQQREMIDSITYAKRLQDAILPPREFIDSHLPQNFVLYKPKDIVAGDFYWAESIGDLFFIAAADSTGHGVPGAMVSVVCSNALNRTVKEFGLTDTGKILDKTRELVLQTFEKSTSEVKDGMDISLLCVNAKSKKVYWSGANNPLWYVPGPLGTSGSLTEIKADKQPIGKADSTKPYTTQHIEYKEGSVFYLFTDGFADQFGGPVGKKFKYKPFAELLLKNSHLAMQEQAGIIEKAFTDWKGSLEQVDDVCVIGIRL
ncbi:MAG: protein serine/threonine phosphatase [Bacteroidetes bacterium]|jgi:serine phosphatase RsbU (regulator of sigma subunit)/Tfp pilus assembly protein PilF|nr:protein serine/threonine phosphatase [Bacteroidota bacterium]